MKGSPALFASVFCALWPCWLSTLQASSPVGGAPQEEPSPTRHHAQNARPSPVAPATAERLTSVVLNEAALSRKIGDALPSVIDACLALVSGNKKRILRAGSAYRAETGSPLTVERPSAPSAEKARWLRRWLSARVPTGSTVVLLGDERTLPTWQVSLGGRRLTTDAPYTDLDGDGVPETAVSRILGSPAAILRQLRGKREYGNRAVVLCSEDTRIHLETRGFARSLGRLGYQVAIRGVRDHQVLSASDLIVHFGHGTPETLSNRWGETFVAAADEEALPRSPIIFADGCGTLPVGSPLLRSFVERGACAYVGATATVQGMIPARFTNELVEHFLAALLKRPQSALPGLLTLARAEYVKGHPGLAEKVRHLFETGSSAASGDDATHLLTIAEWVYYGDPRASIPRAGAAVEMSRRVQALADSVTLDRKKSSWQASFSTAAGDGRAVLALYVEVPIAERSLFRLGVRRNGVELYRLDSRRHTIYQRLGSDCQGGYRSGDKYRARFLVPLGEGAGGHDLEVQLLRGTSAVLTPRTGVDVWPADFARSIRLRLTARPRPRRAPKKLVGKVRVVEASVPSFQYVDLSSIRNRPHDSVRVGGGDNASFKTWFSEDEVRVGSVPFLVSRQGKDVLVSENNTENAYEIHGLGVTASTLHFLIWGYNRPRRPAELSILFQDETTQEVELPLSEWTEGGDAVAFDFENTVSHFKHASVLHRSVKIEHPRKKIVRIVSLSGTYGLIAITVEKTRVAEDERSHPHRLLFVGDPDKPRESPFVAVVVVLRVSCMDGELHRKKPGSPG